MVHIKIKKKVKYLSYDLHKLYLIRFKSIIIVFLAYILLKAYNKENKFVNLLMYKIYVSTLNKTNSNNKL